MTCHPPVIALGGNCSSSFHYMLLHFSECSFSRSCNYQFSSHLVVAAVAVSGNSYWDHVTMDSHPEHCLIWTKGLSWSAVSPIAVQSSFKYRQTTVMTIWYTLICLICFLHQLVVGYDFYPDWHHDMIWYALVACTEPSHILKKHVVVSCFCCTHNWEAIHYSECNIKLCPP